MSCEMRNLQRGLQQNKETLTRLQSKIVFLKMTRQKGDQEYGETLRALRKAAKSQKHTRREYHSRAGRY